MKKMYISPTGKDKFGFNTYIMDNAPDEEVYLEATKDMVSGLKTHKLCWNGGQVVPYIKTANEIAEEETKEKRRKIQAEIVDLKVRLRESDFKAIKFAEGELTIEEYAPIKAERKAWREQINELELLLK